MGGAATEYSIGMIFEGIKKHGGKLPETSGENSIWWLDINGKQNVKVVNKMGYCVGQ